MAGVAREGLSRKDVEKKEKPCRGRRGIPVQGRGRGGWRPGTRPRLPDLAGGQNRSRTRRGARVSQPGDDHAAWPIGSSRPTLRRYPDWSPARTSRGVWTAAAAGLSMLHRNVPSVPVDPELFVAVQPTAGLGRPLGRPGAGIGPAALSPPRPADHRPAPGRDPRRGPCGGAAGPPRVDAGGRPGRLGRPVLGPGPLRPRPPRRPGRAGRAAPPRGGAAAPLLPPLPAGVPLSPAERRLPLASPVGPAPRPGHPGRRRAALFQHELKPDRATPRPVPKEFGLVRPPGAAPPSIRRVRGRARPIANPRPKPDRHPAP